MLTEKENLRRVHRREIPEWIPQNFAAVQLFCPSCYQPHGLPFQGGTDLFGAKWIVENTSAIAEAICKGICEYFGYTYKAPEAPKEPEEEDVPDVLYHVQVGAFRVKENALALKARLEADGYEAFVKAEALE